MADVRQDLSDYSGNRILPKTTYDQVRASGLDDAATLEQTLSEHSTRITEIGDKIQYGTVDLENGISSLNTGTLFVVYE